MRALLGERERVHVRTQHDRLARPLAAQDADDARNPDAFVYLVPEFAQPACNDACGSNLFETKFGMGVQIASRGDYFVKQRTGKFKCRHVASFAPGTRVPAFRLERDGMANLAIGVDLGGSHVLATLVDGDGKIVASEGHDIVDHAPDVVIGTVADAINGVLAQTKDKVVAGIGVGSPGNIDVATGTVRYSPNFGWHNVPLGERLRDRFKLPVFIANDARCATLGEYTHGTGRGTANFVLLTLGTGIGGGIVAEGTLILGALGGAGEVGHHQVRATDGFICACGKTGCFEAQASGTGLIRHAIALASSFPRSSLVSGKPEKLGSKPIRKAAEAGDQHGVAAWNRYLDDLARGLANIIAFVNPEMIALGGGVASAGDFMLSGLGPRVDELTTMVPRGLTKLVVAALGNDAGAIGAATMARRGGLTTAG
jgi:glucokinase